MDICDKSICTGCAACINSCNHNAIKMTKEYQGFFYPIVDEKKCVSCGLCKKVCPANCLSLPHRHIQVYAALVKNDEERAKSTSGGIFACLAKRVIQSGGYVYGAVLDSDLSVHHIEAHTYEEMERLRNSKYVQSDIGLCFQQAKKRLQSGKTVLFSGTPCQIAGLRNYLKKNYSNLLTIDILCHGVPSPGMFQKYRKNEESLASSSLINIQFRTKSIGWKENVTIRKFANGRNADWADTFVPGFLSDYFLRQSCYSCHYSTDERQGDITLGDYWGYRETAPEYIEDDDKGISLVIINTDKGKLAFQSIKREIAFAKRTIDDAKRGNAVLSKPCEKPKDYVSFWNDAANMDWNQLKEKYFQEQAQTDWMSKELREYYEIPFIKRYMKHKLVSIIKSVYHKLYK